MLLIGDTPNLRLKSCCSCDRYFWCQNKFMNPYSVCPVPTQKGERKPSNNQNRLLVLAGDNMPLFFRCGYREPQQISGY